MFDDLDALVAAGFDTRDRRSDWGTFCCLCGSRYGVTDHHWVHTRAARPDLIDHPLNRLPLCHQCHIGIAHKLGRLTFYERYKDKLPTTYRDYFEQEVGSIG